MGLPGFSSGFYLTLAASTQKKNFFVQRNPPESHHPSKIIHQIIHNKILHIKYFKTSIKPSGTKKSPVAAINHRKNLISLRCQAYFSGDLTL